jgi:hypothetical protein
MISFGCIPVCLGLGIMTMSNQHAHHRHAPDYPYLLIKGGVLAPQTLPAARRLPPFCLHASCRVATACGGAQPRRNE